MAALSRGPLDLASHQEIVVKQSSVLHEDADPRGLLEETWLTAAASELVSVRDRTPFLYTPLNRLSSSTATVGTAEYQASPSGAKLTGSTTEV